MAELGMNGGRVVVAVAAAAALGAGACGYARLVPPVDVGAHAGRFPASQEISTPAPIVRLRVPAGWTTEWAAHWGGMMDGPRREYPSDLPLPALLILDPAHQFGGGIYYVGKANGMDIDRIRKREVRDGFARYVDDPSLGRTRLDGRDAFILRGSIDLWKSDLGAGIGIGIGRHVGDVAMAIVPLRDMGTTVVVILASRAGVLSRDPGPAYAIFSTLRFTVPKGWPGGDADADLHSAANAASARAPSAARLGSGAPIVSVSSVPRL